MRFENHAATDIDPVCQALLMDRVEDKPAHLFSDLLAVLPSSTVLAELRALQAVENGGKSHQTQAYTPAIFMTKDQLLRELPNVSNTVIDQLPQVNTRDGLGRAVSGAICTVAACHAQVAGDCCLGWRNTLFGGLVFNHLCFCQICFCVFFSRLSLDSAPQNQSESLLTARSDMI